MKGFWQGFMSADSDRIYSPYAAMALAYFLAAPVMALSSACVIKHVFLMGKGLDAPTVNLLLGMLGSATGVVLGAGATVFSKTMAGASSMFSRTTTVSQTNQPEAPPVVDNRPPRGPKPEGE